MSWPQVDMRACFGEKLDLYMSASCTALRAEAGSPSNAPILLQTCVDGSRLESVANSLVAEVAEDGGSGVFSESTTANACCRSGVTYWLCDLDGSSCS